MRQEVFYCMVFAKDLAICSYKFYCALNKIKILFGDRFEFYVGTRMKLICCTLKQNEPKNISCSTIQTSHEISDKREVDCKHGKIETL